MAFSRPLRKTPPRAGFFFLGRSMEAAIVAGLAALKQLSRVPFFRSAGGGFSGVFTPSQAAKKATVM